MPKDVTHGRGYVYSLQYHIVWVTKYRKSIFVGEIEQNVRKYHLWNPSYFVATVSDRTLEQVKNYMDSQKTK